MSHYNLRPRKRLAPVVPSRKTCAKSTKSEFKMNGTHINALPDVNLVEIFEKLPWKDRLKIEQVCKKWQHLGKNLSWSNYRTFSSSIMTHWPYYAEPSVMRRHTDYGLTECLKLMSSLEYLYIFDGGILLDQYSFVQFPPNLKLLSLNHIENTDQILNWVAKGCKHLKALTVSLARINENGFRAISQMTSLTYLDVPIDRADNGADIGYVFEALTELRAIEINTVDGKIIRAIAQYCKKLEHVGLSLAYDDISPEQHANILRFATLPNLCSLVIWAENYSKDQATELVTRLIAKGNLQYIRLKIKNAPLEPEILFEMLRRCKNIQSVALTFHQIDYSDLYAKTCQVVDEIDKSEPQQSKFPKEAHPIVEVQYKCGFVGNLSARYKWIRFKNYITYGPNAISKKWQYGWLTDGIPLVFHTQYS
ncbi:hypothetical protein Ddc_17102 [Ditylenchus destructor]|nr:hypothetical protein Ddc_17102 [Ditylenchus destructor]